MILTKLCRSDLPIILPWRNAISVRNSMFNRNIISIEEHLDWYEKLQKDTSRAWYVCRGGDGIPVGVVYFTSLTAPSLMGFWGFYTNPDAIAGTGTKMGISAIDFAFKNLGLYKLNAEVLSSNNKSLAYHLRLGFTQEGRFREHHDDGVSRIDIIRFGLLASEWRIGVLSQHGL